ncbi:MAG TPA: hypothetical protein VGL71_11655, partial [Urbifossiella sp.]
MGDIAMLRCLPIILVGLSGGLTEIPLPHLPVAPEPREKSPYYEESQFADPIPDSEKAPDSILESIVKDSPLVESFHFPGGPLSEHLSFSVAKAAPVPPPQPPIAKPLSHRIFATRRPYRRQLGDNEESERAVALG